MVPSDFSIVNEMKTFESAMRKHWHMPQERKGTLRHGS
jgi:hypothetical protein